MRRRTVRRLKPWLYEERALCNSLSSTRPLPSWSAIWKHATRLGSVPGGKDDGVSAANGFPVRLSWRWVPHHRSHIQPFTHAPGKKESIQMTRARGRRSRTSV
ncbi:hypothetical protein NL676_015910 [Syzygium grande]|nr:hypothetical protein NL676_015910 [Syzygium grande]